MPDADHRFVRGSVLAAARGRHGLARGSVAVASRQAQVRCA